jgi:O-antigen ligase
MNFFSSSYLRHTGIYVFVYSIPLPIPLRVTAFFFILMLVNVLLLKGYFGFNKLIQNKFVLVFFAFFAVDFFRSILILDLSSLSFKEVKLSFALIPLLFLWKGEEIAGIQGKLFISFLLGILTYVLYAWGYAVYFYTIEFPHYSISLTNGYLNYLFDYHLPGSIHEAYIGLYIAFGTIFVYIETIVYKRISLRLGLACIIFLSVNLFFIGSKSVIFLFIPILMIISIYSFRGKLKDKSFRSVIMVLCMIIITGTASMITWLPQSVKSSIEKRQVIYACVAEVASAHPWMGVGYKEVRNSSRFCPGYEGELMTHNIFFSELIGNGTFGVVVLAILFVYSFYLAIRYHNLLFGSLLTLFLGVGMIEDVFNRQWGVLFFVFFATLTHFNFSNRLRD